LSAGKRLTFNYYYYYYWAAIQTLLLRTSDNDVLYDAGTSVLVVESS